MRNHVCLSVFIARADSNHNIPMKIHTRTTATTFTTVAIFASAFLLQADDRTASEKARDAAQETKGAIKEAAHEVGRAARIGWQKTKAFFSDDVPAYHEGARTTLVALGKEIAEVKARTPESAPAYFRTRLLSLDQQHDYLSRWILALRTEELRERGAGPRLDFDRCVADLERAIDQAHDGADTLLKTAFR